MSLVPVFYFTSFMLNMFRTLIHPLSGACDFSVVSPHWSCVIVSICFGVSVWLGWGGIRNVVSLITADEAVITVYELLMMGVNTRNM